MRANRGIPPDLEQEANHLKKGQSAFQKKSDFTVQVWKDKRLVQMISRIHACTHSEHRKEIQKNKPTQKPYADDQYNKFMKGTDGADQYLSYYSVLRKTVKWSEKAVLYPLNCAI